MRVLRERGPLASMELQQLTGKSQPTVSRWMAALGPRGVVALGAGRATRYGLSEPILGVRLGRQPVWRHTEQGGVGEQWGTLTLLAEGYVHVEAQGRQWVTQNVLPWFLAPLRLEGFLGRLWARSTHLSGVLGDDPQRWTVQQQLYAAIAQVRRAPGAFTLGDPEGGPAATPVPFEDGPRATHYDEIAADVARSISNGSSAAGEQPKFLVDQRPNPGDKGTAWESLIVKFSPPRQQPFGRVWHDLLHAEALAQQVLSESAEPAAPTRIVESQTRTYLESVRFDRVGQHGRRHAVPLWAIHDAFVGGSRHNWVETCAALAAQKRLGRDDVQRVRRWFAFGELIGNRDMHFGNLSLWADDPAAERFALAPCYDMLPMNYKPDAHDGPMDYLPLPLSRSPVPTSAWWEAVELAERFWDSVAKQARCSADFRSVAALNAQRVRDLRE